MASPIDRIRQRRQEELNAIMGGGGGFGVKRLNAGPARMNTAMVPPAFRDNPELLQAWQRARQQGELNEAMGGKGFWGTVRDTGGGILSGALNLIDRPAQILRGVGAGIANDLIVPVFREAVDVFDGSGDNQLSNYIKPVDFDGDGSTGNDHIWDLVGRGVRGEGVSFTEAMARAGGEGNGTAGRILGTVLGLGTDIATDPLTYVGGAGLVTGGLKGGANLTRASVRHGLRQADDAARATDDTIRALEVAGRQADDARDAARSFSRRNVRDAITPDEVLPPRTVDAPGIPQRASHPVIDVTGREVVPPPAAVGAGRQPLGLPQQASRTLDDLAEQTRQMTLQFPERIEQLAFDFTRIAKRQRDWLRTKAGREAVAARQTQVDEAVEAARKAAREAAEQGADTTAAYRAAYDDAMRAATPVDDTITVGSSVLDVGASTGDVLRAASDHASWLASGLRGITRQTDQTLSVIASYENEARMLARAASSPEARKSVLDVVEEAVARYGDDVGAWREANAPILRVLADAVETNPQLMQATRASREATEAARAAAASAAREAGERAAAAVDPSAVARNVPEPFAPLDDLLRPPGAPRVRRPQIDPAEEARVRRMLERGALAGSDNVDDVGRLLDGQSPLDFSLPGQQTLDFEGAARAADRASDVTDADRMQRAADWIDSLTEPGDAIPLGQAPADVIWDARARVPAHVQQELKFVDNMTAPPPAAPSSGPRALGPGTLDETVELADSVRKAAADTAADAASQARLAEIDRVADTVAEAYMTGGRLAARRTLIDLVGEERALDIWANMPAAAQGGIGLVTPRAMRLAGRSHRVTTEWGTSIREFTRLMPEGTYLADRVPGLSGAIGAMWKARARLNDTRAMQRAIEMFGGKEGAFWASALHLARAAGDSPSGAQYAKYRVARELFQAETATGIRQSRFVAELRASNEAVVNSLGDEGRRVFEDAYHTIVIDRNGTVLNRPASLTADQAMAWNVAETLRKAEIDTVRFAQANGVDVGELNEVGRATTSRFQERVRDLKRVRSGMSETNPTMSRRSGFTIGEDGMVEWTDVRELNRELGETRYLENPFEIASQRISGIQRIAAQRRLVAKFEEAGMLHRQGWTPANVLRNPLEADAIGRRTLDDLEARADRLFAEGANDELNRILAEREGLQQMLDVAGREADPRMQRELYGDIVDHVRGLNEDEFSRLHSQWKKNLINDDEIEKARAAMRARNEELNNLYERRSVLDAATREAVEAGDLVRIPERVGSGDVRLPREFEESFVQPELARAFARMYQVANPAMQGRVVQDFWNPFMSLWRTYATVGRGPGFAFRNLGGGVYNAWLVGAEGADFALGSKYAQLYRQAWKESAETIRSGGEAVLENPGRVLEAKLREVLEPVKFGDTNLWRMHIELENSGLLAGTTSAAGLAGREGVAGDDVLSALLGQRDVLPGVASGRTKRMVNYAANNAWVRTNAGLSEGVERMLRMSSFSAGMRRYGTDEFGGELAVHLVRASQFDYQDLSKFEGTVMRNLIPFFVWTKNNVPLQFRSLFVEPGKVAMMLRAQEAVGTAIGVDDEGQLASTPEWLREALGVPTVLTEQGLTGQGSTSPIVFGMNSPLADLNRLLDVPDDPTNPFSYLEQLWSTVGSDDVRGMTNPVLKAGIEAFSGTNTFTGATYGPVEANGVFRALGSIPVIDRLLDVHTDAATGQTVMSGYGAQQIRNLLPGVGQIERTFPYGPLHSERYQERQLTTWLNQSPIAASPITPMATLTDDQQRSALIQLERLLSSDNRRLAGESGVNWNQLQEARRRGYRPEYIRYLLETDALNWD